MELEQQLRLLADAGFELRPFERYPGFLGVIKGGFAALLQPGSDGFSSFSSTGLLIGGQFALLIQRGDRKVFKAKQVEVEASEPLLVRYHQFRNELTNLLRR